VPVVHLDLQLLLQGQGEKGLGGRHGRLDHRFGHAVVLDVKETHVLGRPTHLLGHALGAAGGAGDQRRDIDHRYIGDGDLLGCRVAHGP
jgi:hypothetical protein